MLSLFFTVTKSFSAFTDWLLLLLLLLPIHPPPIYGSTRRHRITFNLVIISEDSLADDLQQNYHHNVPLCFHSSSFRGRECYQIGWPIEIGFVSPGITISNWWNLRVRTVPGYPTIRWQLTFFLFFFFFAKSSSPWLPQVTTCWLLLLSFWVLEGVPHWKN